MPPLENPRHERVAHGMASGLPAVQAYAEAGYEPDTGNASRLTANDGLRERVQEILDIELKAKDVTPELVVKGLLTRAIQGESEGAQVRAWELLGKQIGMWKDNPAEFGIGKAVSPESFIKSIEMISPEAARIMAPLIGSDYTP